MVISTLEGKVLFYPLAIVVIGLLGIGILYAASPSLFKSILDQFSVFIPSQTGRTISEMGSILFPAGYFTLEVIWGNFTTGFFLSIIVLGVLIYLYFKRSRIEDMFIIVWGFIMLWATLDIRRIAPFFAITVALLTGYLAILLYYAIQSAINRVIRKSNSNVSSRLLEFVGLKAPTTNKPLREVPLQLDYYRILGVPRNATHKQIKKAHAELVRKYQAISGLSAENKERLRQIDRAYSVLSAQQQQAAYDRSEYDTVAQEKDKAGTSKRSGFQVAKVINIALAGLAIFFLVFYPNIQPASETISEVTSFAPSDAWSSSLVWLRDNTPEPFGDDTFYYDLYQTPFNYPETAYGVTAWWDYGYLILRVGHRIPNCDPGAGARESVARLFTAQNEIAANELANNLNSKYIIIDDSTVTEMYYAIATYAGTSSNQFVDVYYIPDNGKLKAIAYYYPEYYQSLAVRLYNFNGNETIPNNTSIISYVEKVSQNGIRYKEVKDSKTFNNYQAAVDYIANQTSGNYRIISASPLISPIPLARLEHYNLVYSSNQSSSIFPDWKIPAVKIFEYTP
jgi:asparagine N-glycosylation enzyme membrane subunit Stt3